MRIVLSLLLGLFVHPPCCGCGTSQPATVQTTVDAEPGYEIVFRFFEYGNAMDKAMDVFSRGGLIITKVQQTYLSNERQEIRITIKCGGMRQINEAEYQLRNVMNVQSVSIHRL